MLISTLGNRMVSGWQEIFECARTHAGVCLPSLSSTITEFLLVLNYSLLNLTRSAVGRKKGT